jgi:hypothetical protein
VTDVDKISLYSWNDLGSWPAVDAAALRRAAKTFLDAERAMTATAPPAESIGREFSAA